MVLTRKTLLEKVVRIKFRTHPKDLSDYIWEEHYYSYISFRLNDEYCNYIVSKIIFPLTNATSWWISPIIYNPDHFSPMRDIYLNDIKVGYLSTELMYDLSSYISGPLLLKEYITMVCNSFILS